MEEDPGSEMVAKGSCVHIVFPRRVAGSAGRGAADSWCTVSSCWFFLRKFVKD